MFVETDNEFYICTRMRILSYLYSHGFVSEFSRPDFKNNKFTVWAFRNTDDLKKCINAYYNNLKNN